MKTPTPKRRGRPVGRNATVRMLTKVPRATFDRLERLVSRSVESRDQVVITAILMLLDGPNARCAAHRDTRGDSYQCTRPMHSDENHTFDDARGAARGRS